MKVHKVLLVSTCVLALAAPAANAKFGDVNIGPVHISPTTPQAPVKIDPVKVGPATVTPPSPVPTPGAPPPHPDVKLDKSVPGAAMFNEANDIARLPETTFEKGANWVAAGVDHLGNEIGMLWAKEKEKAEKAVQDRIDGLIAWLKEQALKYGPKVAAGIVGLIALRMIVRRVTTQRRKAPLRVNS